MMKYDAEYLAVEMYTDNFNSAKFEINNFHDNLAKQNGS